MNKEDIFKSVYEDFFGVEKKKNPAVLEQQDLLVNASNDVPVIDLDFTKNKDGDLIRTKNKIQTKKEIYEDLILKVNDLKVDDKSKEMIKKIFEYMKKYNEKIEKQYISFNMCLFSEDEEIINEILDLFNKAINEFEYLDRGNVKKISFYEIENFETLENIYKDKNNVIAIKNFEVLYNKEKNEKEKILYNLEKIIEENNKKNLTIFIAKTEIEISELFIISEKLKNEFSNFQIVTCMPDVQEIYQEILEKLKENMVVDDEFNIKLLDYISMTYNNKIGSYSKYRDDLCEKILFYKEIPVYEKEKSLDEIFKDLNELVGLEKVKNVFYELVDLIELKKKAKDNLKISNINLHMVFLGNPGTGKTTVARIIAEMLYNLKYIEQNKLIEVSSKDLVAQYVGQTAPKTMSVIEKALGGVLFIDEAYSLASGNGEGNSYNEEAIATLIQAMENYRDRLVVIFAGYTKEMQKFLDSNSGIVSRIGYNIEFEDYTKEELLEIYKRMLKKAGFVISKEAEEKALKIIEENKKFKNFGNARFARNLYEKTVVKHARNTKGKKNIKSLKTITENDF